MSEVFDGTNLFDQYYFDNKRQIHSHGRHGFSKFRNQNGLEVIALWLDGKYVNRSLQKLKRWSCPDKRLRALLKRVQRDFVPVFGFEDMYMFNPKNPLEVFNIEKRYLKSIIKTEKYYQVAIKYAKDQNMSIHQMVMEYHLQKHIDTSKYSIHHLNHNSLSNNISNLLLLPINVHCRFEGYWKFYKNKNPKKNIYTKQDMIDFINDFEISEEDKTRLIKSL